MNKKIRKKLAKTLGRSIITIIILVSIMLLAKVIIIAEQRSQPNENIKFPINESDRPHELKQLTLLADPPLYWKLIPNKSIVYHGDFVELSPTNITINSYGFRDREYSLEKNGSTYRIIILGDSFTFGSGVQIEDTFSKKLESLLNKRNDGRNYEVLNFGVSGYNAQQEILLYEELGQQFNPDLVIIAFYWNDDSDINYINRMQKEILSSEELKRKYNLTSDAEVYTLGDIVLMEERLASIGFEKNWNETVNAQYSKLAEMEPALPVIIYVLAGSQIQKEQLYEFTAKTPNWTVVMSKVQFWLPEYRLSAIDMHPNAAANTKYSEELYPAVSKIIQQMR